MTKRTKPDRLDYATILRAQLGPLAAGMQTEFTFHPTRKWRFDMAWPEVHIAVEVEGGIWTGGAHTRGKHFLSDCEKYNEAQVMDNWMILRFTPQQVNDGTAAAMLRRVL